MSVQDGVQSYHGHRRTEKKTAEGVTRSSAGNSIKPMIPAM